MAPTQCYPEQPQASFLRQEPPHVGFDQNIKHSYKHIHVLPIVHLRGSESFGVDFRIDHARNSRPHLGVKVHRNVRHPIGNLRIRILVVGEDIAEGFQHLRFEISHRGFALLESGTSSSRRKIVNEEEPVPSRCASFTCLAELPRLFSVSRTASDSTVAEEGPRALLLL